MNNKQATEWAIRLTEKARQTFADFRGFAPENYNEKKQKDLLAELLRLEETRGCETALIAMYGDIAIAYLQTENVEKANLYAATYLEINEKMDDQEGVEAAYSILADIAVFSKDFKSFKKYIKLSDKRYSSSYDELIENIKEFESKTPKSDKTHDVYEKAPDEEKLKSLKRLMVILMPKEDLEQMAKEMGIGVASLKNNYLLP